MPRRIESLFINGPVGRLEALLEEPEFDEPIEAALVCHPHPQHGGTMHNKVVYRIARGLRKAGFVVLRFNYRGVNLSEGAYDHGNGELEDARSCLSLLRARYPELPYSIAGFSFGSRISLKLGCQLPDPKRLIAVGFPTIYADRSYLEGCGCERIFLQSTNDEFGPVPDLEQFYATLPQPKQIRLIEAQDHFFAGALETLENAVTEVVLPGGPAQG
jgi:alpha/beta superfamily hydrolase